jgi:hypothetical protein
MIHLIGNVMHACLASLLSAMLLVQAVWGCCWQRACIGEQVRDAGQAHCAAGCCWHPHGRNHQRQLPAPGKCDCQCHGVCIFIGSPKIQLDSQDSLQLAAVAIITGSTPDSFLDGGVRCRVCDIPQASQPPLDLHLLHQVFLI